jgi:glutathione synthase/RimK-type ligase-like ATP-grasp enzyme
MPRSIIFSHQGDVHTDATVWAIRKLGGSAIFVDVDQIFDRTTLSFAQGSTGSEILLNGEPVAKGDGIWLRRPSPPEYFDVSCLHPDDLRYARISAGAHYAGVLHYLGAAHFTVSPLQAMQALDAKALQLHLAGRVGLRTPETLITNDAQVASRFAAHGRTVLKGFLQHQWHKPNGEILAVGVREVTPDDIARASATFAAAPVIQQRLLKSVDEIRVVVIGQNIFCARLGFSNEDGARLDWRMYQSQLRIQWIEPPPGVREGIFQFMRLSGLRYGAFDFIDDGAGWTFLEVNTGGQWIWMNDEAGGLPLLDCFAKYLMAARDDYAYDGDIDVRLEDYWTQQGEAFIRALDEAALDGDAATRPLDRYYRNKTLEGA